MIRAEDEGWILEFINELVLMVLHNGLDLESPNGYLVLVNATKESHTSMIRIVI